VLSIVASTCGREWTAQHVVRVLVIQSACAEALHAACRTHAAQQLPNCPTTAAARPHLDPAALLAYQGTCQGLKMTCRPSTMTEKDGLAPGGRKGKACAYRCCWSQHYRVTLHRARRPCEAIGCVKENTEEVCSTRGRAVRQLV
jgi:hypothetical protein